MVNKVMPNLEGFSGTQDYHRFNRFSALTITDGIKYLAKELGCYWMLDIVASVQHKPKVRQNNSFIIWRLEVKNNSARFAGYTDCEENGKYLKSKKVYAQIIHYTDFPEGVFEFYQQGGVLLLKQEH